MITTTKKRQLTKKEARTRGRVLEDILNKVATRWKAGGEDWINEATMETPSEKVHKHDERDILIFAEEFPGPDGHRCFHLSITDGKYESFFWGLLKIEFTHACDLEIFPSGERSVYMRIFFKREPTFWTNV